MDTDLLGHLAADKRLSALDRYVPRLSIFSALGLARQELAHSRLLATLLDPAQHAGAEPLLRALIVNVGHALAQCASPVATASGGPKVLDRKRGVLSEALRGSRYATSRWGSRAK